MKEKNLYYKKVFSSIKTHFKNNLNISKATTTILHVACSDGWDVAASVGFSVDLKEEVVEGFLEGCARDLRYMQARYKLTKHKVKMDKHYQYQSSSDCVL